MKALTEQIGHQRYEDVERAYGPSRVVEEHRVCSTTPQGVEIDLPVCVVIDVDAQGRITHLREYLDPSAVAKALGGSR